MEFFMGKTYSRAGKLTTSGIVIALYVVVMYFTQSFAFGAYQIRIATSLYALAYIHPFLILPLSVANSISNMLMGGFGIFDTVGGAFAGLVTTLLVCLVRWKKWPLPLIAVPVILGPGLIVATWLSYLIGMPYGAMALSLCIGQIIPGIVGVMLVKLLKDKI